MGYNEHILQSENEPVWLPNAHITREVCNHKQAPQTWMSNSCVWYSQEIMKKIGMQKFKGYVEKFNYGNLDISGDEGQGLTSSWLSSSLKISPNEQIKFLQKLLSNELPVSLEAQELTKKLLFTKDYIKGWELYGKTGSGELADKRTIGWFIGWIKKDERVIICAHYIENDQEMELSPGLMAKDMLKHKLIALLD